MITRKSVVLLDVDTDFVAAVTGAAELVAVGGHEQNGNAYATPRQPWQRNRLRQDGNIAS